MTNAVHTRIAAIGSVVLLSLAVFVLTVSIAQAAGSSPPLRGGAGPTYAASLTPLRGGAGPTYAASLTPLRGGAGPTYAALGSAGITTGFGRSGAFAKTTPATASAAGILGGIAVSALAIALVAFLALGSRSSRRAELAPVTSLGQTPSASPATQYDDRERKAA